MASGAQVRQFVELWHQLRGIQLNSQPDQIQWRFSADGQYSSRSAYRMQFKGSIQDYSWDKIWKVLPLATTAKEAPNNVLNN
jgi:hypothetical protein